MPLRRISSRWTAFYKFVFPVLFAIGCVNVFFLIGPPWAIRGLNSAQDWFVYVIPFLFVGFTVWLGWGLRRVTIGAPNRQLYVSNYRKEISIPFSEIANVTEFRFSDPRRITIHLHNETEFGKKIVFLGTYRLGGWLAGPHPIVDELLKLSVSDQPPRTPKLGPR